jgi:hypothetical protein
MRKFRAVAIVAVGVLVIGLASVALGMKEQPRPLPPPDFAGGRLQLSGPFVILQQGDTSWVQVYSDTTHCPGDPNGLHGGEGTGGPTGAETWCFEGGVVPGFTLGSSDTCGELTPWDTHCFDHVDVRELPSQTGINFWHLDTYRTDEALYCGDYALWCGSDSIWIDGLPVECNIWAKGKKPGYGDQWNCMAQLSLGVDFKTENGCTLYFDPRYDTECKYDYFYVDVYDGTDWVTLATFNGSSNSDTLICGDPSKPNPDWWKFGDTGQPIGDEVGVSYWVPRDPPGEPAFKRIITPDTLLVTEAPQFRWRFTSDGAWSDADGRGNTDGACFIDNIEVRGDGWQSPDPDNNFTEDFEHNSYAVLAANGWTFPNPDPVGQMWHLVEDIDPPYEGTGDGPRTTCDRDSSWQWRARPEQGYKSGTAWRNGWFYRLLSPVFPVDTSGCVVQYDQYMYILEYTCDYTDTKVRFYNGPPQNKWCPWNNIDGFILYGGGFFWNLDREEDVTLFYGPDADSMQFCWDIMDVSSPGDFCRGKHKKTDNVVDNVSVGWFDGNATIFQTRVIDLLQDTFHDSLCAYNSGFDTYDIDTLKYYRGPPYVNKPKRGQQLYLTVVDKNDVDEVLLYGSIDEGATWQNIVMTRDTDMDPNNPNLGGDYYGTLCPDLFGLPLWPVGAEVWYYVRCEDGLGLFDFFPSDANPNDPDHEGTRENYFTFSILPMFPGDYTGTKILLVDGYGRRNYNYAECMAASDNIEPLEDMYEQTLIDAGYCYDKYDISGAGSNVHIHPLKYTSYDAVVWFCGPYFSNYLFDAEAQRAMRAYMNAGGKIALFGDRIAYNMAVVGEDSLDGEFLNGIMGCNYQAEMEPSFDKPWVYLEAAPSVEVFEQTVPINMDSLLVYRQCPYLKDMSYVLTSSAPDTGYLAQPLLYMLNPQVEYDPADGAIYVEKPDEGGQCVFVNYDLCAFATHTRTYCDGSVDWDDPPPAYLPGAYFGRVELMRSILDDIFGLIPPFPGGGGGMSDIPKKTAFRWALTQNRPNPCVRSTEIRFEVARASRVSIKVYNALGQLVRTLENKRLEPGRYSVKWDGTNQLGRKVSSGVYFYKMDANKFSATKKMLVVK